MMNVITSEIYKIFRSKVFYAIAAMLVILDISFCGLSIYAVTKGINGASDEVFTGIDNYQGAFGGDIVFYIILIFVACLVTAEYANGSIRQMASHGIERWKLFIGQSTAMILIISVLMFIYGGINLLISSVLSRFGSVDQSVFLKMNLGLLCMFIGTAGIGILISYIFKNSGIAVGVSVFLVLFGRIAAQIMDTIIKKSFFQEYNISNMRNVILDFESKPSEVTRYSLVFLGIGVACIAIAGILFSKRDID